jgi:hypothetical protein
MKITLKQEMHLQTAEIFLSIERDSLRKDIQNYLNGNGYENKMVNNGIKNYLKTKNIYDESFALTKYGNSVKETGVFKEKEKGKYRVWLNGSRIVFIQRIAPDRYSKEVTDLRLELREEKHFCLPTNEENFYKFKVQTKNICGTRLNGNDVITEIIEITENKAVTKFDGQLIKEVQKKSVEENVEFVDKSLFDIAEMIFEDNWDKNEKRLKVSLNSLDDSAIENFEQNYSNEWSVFNVQVDNLPVEPLNKSEAIEWRNRLLNKEIAKNYLTEKDFDRLVLSINEKDGFSAYASDLGNPKIKEYMEKEIKSNSQEFWNLRAPLDLNPNIPREIVIDNFSLAQNDEYSLKQISEKIETNQVEAVFYYDRFIINGTQQRIAGNFIDSFNSSKKYIITDLNNEHRKSRYIATQKKDIREIDIKNIFGNVRPQHDRYFIYVIGEKMTAWTITNSVDYIEFSVNEFSAETIGKIRTGTTFTKVDVRVLGKELINYINKELKNV